MRSLLKRIRESQLLKPLFDALTVDAVFFFIVLVGLLPGVADYSLYTIKGLSYLDFLFGTENTTIDHKYLLPIFIIPVGVSILLYRKNYWGVLAILPSIVMALSLLHNKTSIDVSTISIILSIAYKIAFLYFIIMGHLRSIYFLGFLVLIVVYLSWPQLFLFVVFSLLFRFLVLFYKQNITIFNTVNKKKLGILILKSFILWCPILLLMLPHHYAIQKAQQLVEDFIYDQTFVERHFTKTELSWNDLKEFNVESYVHNFNNKYEVQLSMQGLPQRQFALYKSVMYVKAKTDSLRYTDHNIALLDFDRVYKLYLKKSGRQLDMTDLFFLKSISREIDRLVVMSYLTGRSKMEMDVELSINDIFLKKENILHSKLDSVHGNSSAKLHEQMKLTDLILFKFTLKSEELARRTKTATIAQRNEIITETNANATQLNESIHQNLGELNTNLNGELDKIPLKAASSFDAAIPRHLTDVSSTFENQKCKINIRILTCAILNEIREMFREAYDEQYGVSREFVVATSEALRDSLKEQMGTAIAITKVKTETTIQETREGVNLAASNTAATIEYGVDTALINVNLAAAKNAKVVQSKLKEVSQKLDKATSETQRKIKKSFEAVRKSVSNTMLAVNHGLTFYKYFSRFLLALLIFNSFFYVFSRVAFADGHNLFVSLTEGPKKFGNGFLKKCGTEYSIPPNHKETFFVSRKFKPSGRAPKFIIPQWVTSMPSRVHFGSYVMNEVTVREGNDQSIDFRSQGGAEFVEWKLAEGEQVIFSYRNFVAMTSSVKIETVISVRLTSMIFGSCFFAGATGPGTLILHTKGRPITNNDEKMLKTIPAERLVAWQRSTLFSVDSELNMVDIYLSGLYLRKASDDLMVMDADDVSGVKELGYGTVCNQIFIALI